MLELYAAIWRVSGRRQVILILLSMAIAALAAVPLSYQKDIINELTAADIHFDGLVRLCAEMMGVVLLSLALKWALGFLSNLLGRLLIPASRRSRWLVVLRWEAVRQKVSEVLRWRHVHA